MAERKPLIVKTGSTEPEVRARRGDFEDWITQGTRFAGADVMRGYVRERAHVLRDEGFDPVRLVRETRDSPHGPAVLRRFGEIVRGA